MGRTDGKRERCEIKDALRNMRKSILFETLIHLPIQTGNASYN